MKLNLILFAAVLFTGISHAQTENLPAESKELLQKLESWELEKQIDLKKEFQEKRKSVADVLNQQLTAATKRGDLDGAIAIRKEIVKLTTAALPEALAVGAENKRVPLGNLSDFSNSPTLERLTEKALIGTKWIYPYLSRKEGQGEMLLEFKKDGNTYVMFRKPDAKWKFHMSPPWEIVDDWTVKTFISGINIEISKDLKEMTWGDNKAVRYVE